MDFGLSEEQVMLQETVRGFVDNECPTTRLREIFDGDEGWDPAHWKGLVEMGIAGLVISEEYGGAGLEVIDLALQRLGARRAGRQLLAEGNIFLLENPVRIDELGDDDLEPLEIVLGGVEEFGPGLTGDRLFALLISGLRARCFCSHASSQASWTSMLPRTPWPLLPDSGPRAIFSRERMLLPPASPRSPEIIGPGQAGALPRELRA